VCDACVSVIKGVGGWECLRSVKKRESVST